MSLVSHDGGEVFYELKIHLKDKGFEDVHVLKPLILQMNSKRNTTAQMNSKRNTTAQMNATAQFQTI